MSFREQKPTTIRQLMEGLIEHLESLPEEEREAWGRDLVKWADEREAKSKQPKPKEPMKSRPADPEMLKKLLERAEKLPSPEKK